MSDINIGNLDAGQRSPKLARLEILDAVQRVSALTRYIQTADPATLVVSNKLSVIGDVRANGNLHVQGQLSFGNTGTAGNVLTSQGPGQPATWSTVAAGDKYKASSTSNLTIDAVTPKTVVIQTDLSYTTGQFVVVTNNATRYMGGTVQSYDPATGSLIFANEYQVGSGSFSSWTVNIAGKAGTNGVDGTIARQWYNSATAPSNSFGADNDYFLHTTTSDYYQKKIGVWTLLGNLKGSPGTAGSAWYNGTTAPSAGSGADNDYYINKTNGDYYQKQTGTWVLQGNLTGPSGSGGGGGGSSTVFSTVSRYQANTTTGQGCTIVSSCSFKTGLAWTRTTTTLTITDAGHGRSVGERAIVRNTNVTYFDSLITAVTTDTFSVTTTDTGSTSGTAAVYGMGFTMTYTGAPSAITGAVVTAPANWDCVLLAVRMHVAANTRTGAIFNFTIPKGNINGGGLHTGMDNISIPIQQVRQDGNSLSAVGATISTNTGIPGDYATYQWAALPATTTGIHITANF